MKKKIAALLMLAAGLSQASIMSTVDSTMGNVSQNIEGTGLIIVGLVALMATFGFVLSMLKKK